MAAHASTLSTCTTASAHLALVESTANIVSIAQLTLTHVIHDLTLIYVIHDLILILHVIHDLTLIHIIHDLTLIHVIHDLAECHRPKDVAFALDASGSIGRENFHKVVEWARNVVRELPVDGSGGSRVSLETYGDTTKVGTGYCVIGTPTHPEL